VFDTRRVELGFGFWAKWAAVAVGAALAAMILFFLLGVAWAAWGALGTLLFVAAVLLLFGWWYDQREAKRQEELEG
jgi:hypothetical protein